METKEIISGQESYDQHKEMLEQSPEMQRFNFYTQKVYNFTYINKKETDTHVYWSVSEKTPRFENERLFYLHKNTQGVTYDKQAKTIKIWFGLTPQKLTHIMLDNIVKHFNIDWYENLSQSLLTLLNKTMLQNMIKGKITNHRHYVKAYLKTSPYKKMDISIELFYQVFTHNASNSPKFYRKVIEYSTDPNHALELIKEHGDYISHNITDLYAQAAILNRKVNPKWSTARFKEVHNEWTREIMSMQIKSIKPVDYDYPVLNTPEGIELIKNNYELFEEGSLMKHCIYTNYEYRIRNKAYFALNYMRDGVRATVGININSDKTFEINQMYGIGNSSIANEHKDYVKNWISTEDVQKWFISQTSKELLEKADNGIPDWL
jgi:hypothetical protein